MAASTYVSFQCSVCRRTKDILRDNFRAAPNHCNITKGCEGRLFKVGEKTIPDIVSPASGLTDWYPRGQTPIITEVTEIPAAIALTTSVNGALTLAIYQSDTDAALRQTLIARFTQRRTEDIKFNQFLFKTVTQTSIISGRDSSGKNLRFDQIAIDEGRVFVRVNGISRFQGSDLDEIVLTPNTVSFNSPIPAAATVDVSVSTEKGTLTRDILFTQNATGSVITSGSWTNVRWVREHDNVTKQLKPNRWWLYTSENVSSITSGSSLKLDGIFESDSSTLLFAEDSLAFVRFFLAASPYAAADRYLNLIVEANQLSSDFAISVTTDSGIRLFADHNALIELYPPLTLVSATPSTSSSFITPDEFIGDTSIPSDTSAIRLVGKKILGPL